MNEHQVTYGFKPEQNETTTRERVTRALGKAARLLSFVPAAGYAAALIFAPETTTNITNEGFSAAHSVVLETPVIGTALQEVESAIDSVWSLPPETQSVESVFATIEAQ